jgi:hypothetical protein
VRTYLEETIDPGKAAEYLEHNDVNRTIRPHKVTEYARAMKAGRWRVNGAGIVFDDEGHLVDGQHRLKAIIESDTTIVLLVTRGVSPNVRPTVDEGIKRQFKDDLAMTGVVSAHANAALLRKILVWKQNGGLANLDKTSIGRPEMSAKWPPLAHDVTQTIRDTMRWKMRWPGNKGGLDFFYWLLMFENENNPETVEEFFQILTIGSQNPDDRLLLHVQDALAGRYTQYKKDRRQTGVPYQAYWLSRGWNGWLHGDKLTRLALPPGGLADPFPKLLRARPR